MIADASVLILFARAGRLHLLRELFEAVQVPDPVAEEVFVRGPASADVRIVTEGFEEALTRVALDGEALGAMAQRFPSLGLGETACLTLAVETNETTVLMDDGSARKAARMMGLTPVGSLGVLQLARRKGQLAGQDELARAVRDVLHAGLWVSADVLEAFWARAGGRP